VSNGEQETAAALKSALKTVETSVPEVEELLEHIQELFRGSCGIPAKEMPSPKEWRRQ